MAGWKSKPTVLRTPAQESNGPGWEAGECISTEKGAARGGWRPANAWLNTTTQHLAPCPAMPSHAALGHAVQYPPLATSLMFVPFRLILYIEPNSKVGHVGHFLQGDDTVRFHD